MCGITGIVDLNGNFIESETISRMIKTLDHRGPDDEGIYVENVERDKTYPHPDHSIAHFNNVCLGHKRLSIIDLSEAARQPLSNEDGTIWLVCNGEIYNYRELTKGIKEMGHRLRSGTDSEVIIHLYEDYGEDCVDYLRGMFAFGIWDSRKGRLIIARDHVGIKPLYYYFKDGRFIFASEIKAILANNDVKREIDISALGQYLSFLYIPAPRTIFKDIYKVMPGNALRLEDGQLKEKQYWDLAIEEGMEDTMDLQSNKILSSHTSSSPIKLGQGGRGKGGMMGLKGKGAEDYYADKVYELLRESVRIMMISDVALGAFLSGGIDSSAIVAIMSEFSTGPVKTFSIGFGGDECNYDELKYARVIANKFRTDHREFVVKSDIVELLPTVVKHFDEPFANPTAVLMYLLSKETKRHVSVALSGTGGDEAFAGYTRYAGMKLTEYAGLIPTPLRRILRYLSNKVPESSNGRHLGRRTRHFIEGTLLSPEDRYMAWVSIFDDGLKDELFRDVESIIPFNGSRRRLELIAGSSYLRQYLTNPWIHNIHNRIFYTDVKTYLPNNQLEYVDKMSMAHSLEVRVPFCDHRLLEFSATIPFNLKLKGLNTKYLLKKAVARVLPPDIINRKKVGFNVPLGLWFQGRLSAFIRDELSENNLKRIGFFNHKTVKRIIDEHSAGKRDFSLHLWALLVFQVWYNLYVK